MNEKQKKVIKMWNDRRIDHINNHCDLEAIEKEILLEFYNSILRDMNNSVADQYVEIKNIRTKPNAMERAKANPTLFIVEEEKVKDKPKNKEENKPKTKKQYKLPYHESYRDILYILSLEKNGLTQNEITCALERYKGFQLIPEGEKEKFVYFKIKYLIKTNKIHKEMDEKGWRYKIGK